MSSITSLSRSIPVMYDQYLGPILFENYALDLVERIKNKKHDQVLELACGTGRVTWHLSQLIPPGRRLIATDLNPDMLAVAQTKVTEANIQWQVADAQYLSYRDSSIDLVVCQFGVMLFPDKEKAFKEARRVLKNAGVFLFSVWDHIQTNPLSARINKVIQETLGADAPDFLTQGPYSFYDQGAISSRLLAAGFSHVQITAVSITAYTEQADNLWKGFIEGSPLRLYLEEMDAASQKEVRNNLQKEFTAAYGNGRTAVPMQALVCEAIR